MLERSQAKCFAGANFCGWVVKKPGIESECCLPLLAGPFFVAVGRICVTQLDPMGYRFGLQLDRLLEQFDRGVQ